jgi:aminomethyltransferase
MGRVEIAGSGATDALDAMLVSRVRDLEVGRSRYTMLCDEAGGVIDDLIVTRLEDRFLLIVNAANTDAALAVLREGCATHGADVIHRAGHVLLALQGPEATHVLATASAADLADGAADATQLRPFRAVTTRVAGVATVVARTGYTGEDGFEVACEDAAGGRRVWEALLAAGAASGLQPCGLAARDTLRLEAGLPLHGHELGPELGPFETGFARIVHLDDAREFHGRAALERVATDGPVRRIVGLIAEGRRAPRAGYTVLDDERAVGTITSGAPSPTLGVPIALAAVDASVAAAGTVLHVDVRGTRVLARVTALPFVLPAARRATARSAD